MIKEEIIIIPHIWKRPPNIPRTELECSSWLSLCVEVKVSSPSTSRTDTDTVLNLLDWIGTKTRKDKKEKKIYKF